MSRGTRLKIIDPRGINVLMRNLVILLLAFSVAACADRASSVAPVSVSAGDYASMSCGDTKAMLKDKRVLRDTLVNQQNNAAIADAVTVFLVLLPLGSVFGADVEGELAAAKGEVNALERAVRINCRTA